MATKTDIPWQDDARCAEVGTEVFFLEDTDNAAELAGMAKGRYNEAKRVCASCPVSALCLDEAMTLEAGLDGQWRYGVWGGMSPRERAEIEKAAT
jgi:WhiB family redox-sensing transcriptional regulator